MYKGNEIDYYNDHSTETENYYEDPADIACELRGYADRFCSSFDDEWN